MSETEPEDDLMEHFKLDRTVTSVGFVEDSDAERCAYWHLTTPEERLLYMEHLRRMNYGTGPATQRLQRILEIVEPGAD